jgi:hypothetical protein
MPTFTVQSVSNPVYTNEDGTGIDVQIKFAEFPVVLPFHATSWDIEVHGRQIFNDLKAGVYGEIAPYVLDLNKLGNDIRSQRDLLLKSTDWTQGADVPSATKEKWVAYRQALRDITQQSTFPETVTWPTEPA